MKNPNKKWTLKKLWWRLTGYRELSGLLHAHACSYDALTPVGIERMNKLIEQENVIHKPIGWK